MNRRSTILVSSALLVLVGTLLAFSNRVPAEPKIGFVNLERAIAEYKKTRKITSEIEKDAQAIREIARQKTAKLRTRQSDLLHLDRNSIEYMRESRDLKLIKLREDNRARGMEIDFRLQEHVQMVYKEIVQVVEGIARQRGLIAVFQITDAELVSESKGSPKGMIAIRNTVWCDGAADLTDKLIEILNK